MKDHADGLPSVMVIPDFPTLDTGGGQRSLLILEAAAGLGPVHVAILSDAIPDDPLPHLPQAASVVAWGSWSTRSPQGSPVIRLAPRGLLRLLAPSRFARVRPEFQAKLDDLIARTGARAVLFRYFSGFSVTGLSRRPGLAVLVDIDDRDDQKYAARLVRLFGERLASIGIWRLSLLGLTRLMKRRLAQASLVWFAAPEDIWTLPGARSALLPNVATTVPSGTGTPLPSQGDSVLFVGIYNHTPNQDGIRWFLDHCWADLSRRFPDIRLRLVGRGTQWPEMAARYTHLEQVDFVGPVDDLAAEYARARLCICPVREGGGSKIKVIEAAAFGRPIVGVPHAFRGFAHGIHDHAAEAPSPEAFVAACAAFLQDGELADRTGAALAQWQRRHYSREAVVEQVRADIASVLT